MPGEVMAGEVVEVEEEEEEEEGAACEEAWEVG